MNHDVLMFDKITFLIENVYTPKGETSEKIMKDLILEDIKNTDLAKSKFELCRDMR